MTHGGNANNRDHRQAVQDAIWADGRCGRCNGRRCGGSGYTGRKDKRRK